MDQERVDESRMPSHWKDETLVRWRLREKESHKKRREIYFYLEEFSRSRWEESEEEMESKSDWRRDTLEREEIGCRT